MNWYGLLPPKLPHPTGWLVVGRVSPTGECRGPPLNSRHAQCADEPHPLGRLLSGHRIRRHRFRDTARRRHRPVTAAGQPARIDPASLAHRRDRPCGAAGCATGPGPSTRRGADEFVAVSWDELTELLAGELRRVVDSPRQRGDLRRLVRLGQRRPVPPRAEPGAPLPQTPWRVHLFAALLQSGRHRGDHAAGGRHPRRPVQAVHRNGRSSSSTPTCWCASAVSG